ncbi:hypothetical protein ACVXHA_10750 [Escherichia coli]
MQRAHHVRVVSVVFAAVDVFSRPPWLMGLRASQARFDRFSRSCWKS